MPSAQTKAPAIPETSALVQPSVGVIDFSSVLMPVGSLGVSPDYASSGVARSNIFDLENFVGPLAAGGAHLDRVALFFADKGAGDRGFQVQHPIVDICFMLSDNLPRLFFVGVFIDKRDRRPEFYSTGQASGIDHFSKA